jgi:hypothetical protein
MHHELRLKLPNHKTPNHKTPKLPTPNSPTPKLHDATHKLPEQF